MSFYIHANGTPMGEFEGTSADSALNAYAQDAGYRDFADLLERVPGSSRDEVLVVNIENALAQLADTSDSELYAEVEGEMFELTDRGCVIAENAGLTVDIDAYGCAYCVETVEAEREQERENSERYAAQDKVQS